MRFYYDKKNGFKNEHDQTCHSTPGMMSTLAHIDGAQCDDGKRRSVRITGYPDTFFSVPAECTVNRKTVSGFITTDNGEYRFHATGKNRELITRALCQCQARHCSTCGGKAPEDKYKLASVSILNGAQMMQALCEHCAPDFNRPDRLAQGFGLSCEDSQIESDKYYGAMRGMTGAEYAIYITKQYEQTNEQTNEQTETNENEKS